MKTMFTTVAIVATTLLAIGQEKPKDSLEGKEIALDEVLVSAVRVTKQSPVTFTNLTKEQIKPRNLGQDIPILMNFLPAVVTTSDAGAGIGYTGIRVRGSDGTRVNVTINGIPYNDAESHGSFWVNMPDFCLFHRKFAIAAWGRNINKRIRSLWSQFKFVDRCRFRRGLWSDFVFYRQLWNTQEQFEV